MAIQIRSKEDLLEHLTFFSVEELRPIDNQFVLPTMSGYFVFQLQHEVKMSNQLVQELPIKHIVELINNHFLTIMKEAPLVYIPDDDAPTDNCSFFSPSGPSIIELCEAAAKRFFRFFGARSSIYRTLRDWFIRANLS